MAKGIINEALLQQIETLQTLLENNIGGLFGGNRKSKTYGSSCEFADYREYIAGDDITKIDWNVFARTDNLYQKLYLDERQMHTRIYIDASRSMGYGKNSKANQALRLAAAFAYLSVHEMDKVSVYVVQEKKVEEIVSSVVGKDAYAQSIFQLNKIKFDGDSYISDAILQSKVGMGDGLSIIISDFLTDNNYEAAIDYLVEKKRDVLCLQVLSRDELNPKLRGKSHLFDSENTEKEYRKNITKEIARAYKAALEYATGRIKNYCFSRGAKYLLVSADEEISKVFFENLPDMGVLK